MAEMTLEQQKAIAMAAARKRAAEARNADLETEISQKTLSPQENFMKFGSPSGPETEAQLPVERPEGSTAPGTHNFPQNMHDIMLGGDVKDDPLGLWVPEAVGGGIYNSGAEIAKTGAAGLDYALGTDTLPAIEEVLPEYQADTTKGEVLSDLTQVGTGIIGGVRAVPQIIKSATKYGPKIINATAKMIGANTGAAITSDKNTKPLITGEDAVVGDYAPSVQINDDDDEETKYLKRTVNLGIDATAIGMGLAGPAAVTGKALKYGKDIVTDLFMNYRNADAIGKNFVEIIIDRAAQLPPNATAQETAQAYKDIAEFVQQNKDAVFNMGDDGAMTVGRDTISTLEQKGLSAPVAGDLQGLRQAARQGNSPLLEETLKQPRKGIEMASDTLFNNRGGSGAIEQTRQNIVKGAREQVAPVEAQLSQGKADLANAQEGVEGLVKDDPTFGPALREAQEQGVDLNIGQKGLDLQDEAVAKAEARRVSDRTMQKEAHAAIPKGTKADMKSFREVYDKAKDSLPKEINELVAGNKAGTYEYLQNTVRPRLSEYIRNVQKGGNPNNVNLQALYDLQNNIRGTQLETLIQRGNAPTVEAAKKAVAADKEVGTRWNQGIGSELQENTRKALPDGKGGFLKTDEQIEGGRKIVLGAIKDPNRRESVKRLGDILGPNDEGLIGDIAIADVMKDLKSKLSVSKGGKLSDLEVSDIAKPLTEMSAALNPAQQKRVTDFVNGLREKKWNVKEIEDQVAGFEQTLKETQENVYNRHLNEFFKKQGGEYAENPNGTAILEKMFRDPQASTKFSKIVEGADEVTKKGMQAAWAQAAKKQMLANTDTPILSPEMQEYGKIIYGEGSPVVDSLLGLNQQANKLASSLKGRQGSGLPIAENQIAGEQSTNTLLTWIFGVLNPTAARVRKISGKLLKDYDSKDLSRQVADKILSDPEEFSRIAKILANKKSKELGPEGRNLIYRFFTNKASYGTNEQTEDNLKK